MRRYRVLAVCLAIFGATLFAVVPFSTEEASAACNVPACAGIPGSKQAVAQQLLAHPGFSANGYPSLISREIAPIANGNVAPTCDVDVRVLQVLLILVKNFGSVNVTDMNRHCADDKTAQCYDESGNLSSSRHCTPLPASALDIDRLGGLTAGVSMSQTMLSFISTFVPSGTWAEINCESGGYPNLTRFSYNNSCTHQHIDFRETSAPLNIAPSVETMGRTYAGSSSWIYESFGISITGASSMSAVYMSGSWPTLMVNANGTLRHIYRDSSGWHSVSTGIQIGGATPIAALNKGGTAPRVYANVSGNLWEIYKSGSTWYSGDTGIDIGAGSPITVVDIGGSWGDVWANIGGVVHRIYGNSSGWHIQSSGKNIGAGTNLSGVKLASQTHPQFFMNIGGGLYQMWASNGAWNLGYTGVAIGGAQPSALDVGTTHARVYVSIGSKLHQIQAQSGTWIIQNTGANGGSAPVSAVRINGQIQAITRN